MINGARPATLADAIDEIGRLRALLIDHALLRAVVDEVISALDAAGGDTDPPGHPEDWRDSHTDLWACWRLGVALEREKLWKD